MWIARYVAVIAVAVILAAALGEMELFKTTRFGKGGLNAARVAQFFGYGGALLVLWLLARRAASLLPEGDGPWGLLRNALVPLVTLIVVACAQAVILLVLAPFLSSAVHAIYNWTSIAAIILSAAWLLWTLFTGSSSLVPLFDKPSKASQADRDGETRR